LSPEGESIFFINVETHAFQIIQPLRVALPDTAIITIVITTKMRIALSLLHIVVASVPIVISSLILSSMPG